MHAQLVPFHVQSLLLIVLQDIIYIPELVKNVMLEQFHVNPFIYLHNVWVDIISIMEFVLVVEWTLKLVSLS